jgi:predicted nucleic acid-binding protein
MILVDSSVWIDFFRGIDTAQTDRLYSWIDTKQLGVGDLVLVEVLQGCDKDKEFGLVRLNLEKLERVEIAGWDVALQAATYYRTLRGLGITVRKTIDSLIATRCIMDGHQLLFSDRDFIPFVTHFGLRDAMVEPI